MKPSLSDESLNELTDRLRRANEEFTHHYLGETGRRQPVHTVYGGAHLFKAETAAKLGATALRVFQEHAPDSAALVMARKSSVLVGMNSRP